MNNLKTKKIALLQVWLGPLPTYFKYHFETIKKLEYIDFLFFTDQEINFESENLKVNFIDKDSLENLFYEKTKFKLNLTDQYYKITDLKASYGHLFEDYLEKYDYFGVYDIDTLFGDIEKFISPYLYEYDLISFGTKKIFNRTSGPFLLFRNTEKIKKSYNCNFFFEMLSNPEIVCFEEDFYFQNIVVNDIKYKIIYDVCNFIEKDGFFLNYSCIWKDGRLEIDNNEKMLFHFKVKDYPRFDLKNNSIEVNPSKVILNDFKWITYFSENYEDLVVYLIESVQKYSNRKLILFTINYEPTEEFKNKFNSKQIEFVRFDINKGPIDFRGRDFNILSSKPLICLEALKLFPDDKFVYIDTDVYCTVNCDRIHDKLHEIENYPLFNSHTHDVIYISNILENEEWTDTVQHILNEFGISNDRIFPRRKANLFLFDQKCYLFFREQMILFDELFLRNKIHILALHDEDLANVILTKNKNYNCLPLVDIEESYELNLNKIEEYSFSMSENSANLIVPKSINDFIIFHGFKKNEDYIEIKKSYTPHILKQDDFIIEYKNHTLTFYKNNFLNQKVIENSVDFIIEDQVGNQIIKLSNQQIFNFFLFYISNLYLENGYYKITIQECNSHDIIYNNYIKIQ